jgi:hypothetical protein
VARSDHTVIKQTFHKNDEKDPATMGHPPNIADKSRDKCGPGGTRKPSQQDDVRDERIFFCQYNKSLMIPRKSYETKIER